MQATEAKQISCKRCQKRKIKCSKTQPCQHCALANVTCEFRNDGSRKFPTSRDYVESLESRVAVLESFLAKLKAAPSDERDSMIDNISFLDHYDFSKGNTDESSGGTTAVKAGAHTPESEATLHQGADEDSITYHGPTSIYTGALSRPQGFKQLTANLPYLLNYPLDAGEMRVNECIALFFRWQYPQFMFIDREAFIMDFQAGTFNGQFCSSALVNAICSIGALMSTNPAIRAAAATFAETAWSLLVNFGLSTPHTTSVQTLMCCAFYEIGAGQLSRGWLYSGMAIHMGQDLGFHRDPATWTKATPETGTLEEEYRRRIYWGCYISDKLFSLFLGRASVMHESDADVKPSKPLPQVPAFNNWAEKRGFGPLKEPMPFTPKLALTFNKQIEIGKIIREALSLVYSPSKGRSHHGAELALNEINAKLSRFKDHLPSEMRLKEWSSVQEPVQPHLAALHMLHHGTSLSLNRPFLRPPPTTTTTTTTTTTSSSSSSKNTCLQAIERMILIFKRFRHQQGLRYAPLTFVYGAISAINAILAIPTDTSSSWETNPYLPDFELFLSEMSPTWSVAGDMLNRIKNNGSSSRWTGGQQQQEQQFLSPPPQQQHQHQQNITANTTSSYLHHNNNNNQYIYSPPSGEEEEVVEEEGGVGNFDPTTTTTTTTNMLLLHPTTIIPHSSSSNNFDHHHHLHLLGDVSSALQPAELSTTTTTTTLQDGVEVDMEGGGEENLRIGGGSAGNFLQRW